MPLLGYRKQGELQLFSKEHFLDLPWPLDQDDPSPILTKFKIVDESQTGQIDVSDSGKVEIDFARRVQGELSAVIQEPAWTLPRLSFAICLQKVSHRCLAVTSTFRHKKQ